MRRGWDDSLHVMAITYIFQRFKVSTPIKLCFRRSVISFATYSHIILILYLILLHSYWAEHSFSTYITIITITIAIAIVIVIIVCTICTRNSILCVHLALIKDYLIFSQFKDLVIINLVKSFILLINQYWIIVIWLDVK